MRKKILQRKRQRFVERRTALQQRAQASTDAAEVRGINEQITDINAEIADIDEELKAIEEEEQQRSADPVQAGAQIPQGAQLRGGTPVGSFQPAQPAQPEVPILASAEYRSAFRAYATEGTTIPAQFRNGETITTQDTGAAIPWTIMNEVINTVRKRYGNLYNKVRKTSVRGGVEYPVGALQATFKWINESTVSPRQKIGTLGKVVFQYHVGEIRVSQTFLSQLLTLEAFEAKIAECIAIAYLQAMDAGIISGSGDGSMLGIVNDPRVTNTITMTAADINNWTKWRKNFFAKLPLGYRAGEFVFPVGTVDAYLETMADSNNNPIFRQATGLEVNDGDAMNPNGRFFGREISLVEPDIIPDFDTAQAGDVIGIFWQPQDYAINENFAWTMRRYFDEELNEWVNKALVVTDGKILNPTGYYKIIKG
jgi:HK97 family phage major capsid protein